jgi:N-acetylneuraminate synthase/N,N'-diacetyllegionaminate synthase
VAPKLIFNKFPKSFSFGGREVANDAPCFIIAEGGVSHLGVQSTAYDLIDLAVSAGVDCYKTQHYDVQYLYGDNMPEWKRRLGAKQLTDQEIFEQYEYCKSKGMLFLCTAHDEHTFEFIRNEIRPEAYKIGSGEIGNYPFIEKIAKLGKPIILSTGMYSLDEIFETVKVIHDSGAPPLAILHCVTKYPATPEILNLGTIPVLKKLFNNIPIGYSDHTVGDEYPLVSRAMGAALIEKHITIEKNIPDAQDWKVALDADTLPSFVEKLRKLESSLGVKLRPSDDEIESLRWASKTIVCQKNIAVGEMFTPENICMMRVGSGLAGKYLSSLLKMKARRNIVCGEIINLGDCES